LNEFISLFKDEGDNLKKIK